jgi:hypothetical protein
MWSYFVDLGKHLNIAQFWHVFDVFSLQVYPIEPIPFALCQASLDTSVEYIVFLEL